jgi:2-dehydro-3-deoxygalactonokinase
MSIASNISWIAVDWGTTHLRSWAVDAAGAVLENRRSDSGMNALKQGEFEAALLELTTDWLRDGRTTPAICCGMVGSRQGWVEAPYLRAPCPPVGPAPAVPAPGRNSRLRVFVVPGLKQETPADVMRGEETQIAGLLAKRPDFDGVVCLPGTHTKWVHVSAGEVVSFQTYLTGELFALLSRQSVLRHFIAAQGWDETAFQAALASALSRPSAVAARLFSLRASALISDLDAVSARATLSGLLVGLELGAARPYWLGREVVVLGADALAGIYRTALLAQGVRAEQLNAEALTLAGLATAHALLTQKEQVN